MIPAPILTINQPLEGIAPKEAPVSKEHYTKTIEDLTTATSDTNVRYIHATRKLGDGKFLHETTQLTKSPVDGFWRDPEGTIFAFSELHPGDDPRIRCGSGFFSLPLGDPRNQACGPHDFEYSSPVYQAYHTRSEADEGLEARLKMMNYPITAELFEEILKFEGKNFWDTPATNV